MVKPVTTQGATSIDVIFPGKDEVIENNLGKIIITFLAIFFFLGLV